MATTTRTDERASQFEAVNAEIIAIVTDCGDEQWRLTAANDERTVGVVAYHAAETNGAFARIIQTLAAGGTYTPSVSMEEVHQLNAQQARDNAEVGRQETLDLLRANGDAILHALRNIDDDQLERTAGTFGGHEMTINQVMEWVVIGHTAEHLESIRATLAG